MPHASKSLWSYLNPCNSKLFRSRNIIVVSQGEVKHYPVSSTLQLFCLAVVMGTLSWGSYSTGSYFAAQTILEEKERKIETTTMANRRIEEQYGLLKRDLAKLTDKEGELSEYERFVISQHHQRNTKDFDATRLNDGGLASLGHSLLQDRIDYLEGLVDQLKTDRETLVSSIRERTKEQITAFEDIIENTGLTLAKLSNHPQAKLKVEEIETAGLTTDESGAYVNQGGPYVPDNPTATMLGLEEEEQSMMSDLNTMLLLSDIHRALPLAPPILEDHHLSSSFGRRVDPITKRWAIHRGLDFVGQYGSKIHATAPGTITYADRNGAYGNFVEIDHGYGITTRYAHLKTIAVAQGDTVNKGDVIGLQGNTGRSTGSHLHYEVRFNRTALNPRKFIEAHNDVFEKKE